MTAFRAHAALAAFAGVCCIAPVFPVLAQDRTINVPSQSAADAIPELAQQSGIQIIVRESAVRDKVTATVRGVMSPREALQRLLAGTDLQAIALDSNTYRIVARPAQQGAPDSGGPAQIVPESEIIVTGFRSSLTSALTRKKQEAASVDTILAEDIGKFPDSNLAESMQRLPGVALSRGDGGEGRNITVRGLAAEFTRVRINGIESTSQTAASDAYGGSNRGRGFDFNVFPSEIFSSLAVRKTPSANIEEGSLGATIDLKAPHPLDYNADFVLTATARAGYNDIARQVDPKMSALVSKTFADDTMGVLASIAYTRRRTRDVGYSAVLVLPAWVNGGFCSPVGVAPINPDPADEGSLGKGVDTLNCSAGNPRTGSVNAYEEIQSRRGPSDRPGGGAFFPRLPRYLDAQQELNRLGGTLTFQWQPDDNTEIAIDGLYTRYGAERSDSYISGLSFARSESNNGQPMTSVRDVEIDPLGSVVYGLYDGVDVRSERWVSEFTTEFTQATLDFGHRFSDRFKLSGIAGLSVTDFNQPERGWFNIDANDTNGFSVDFRENSHYPTIGFGTTDVSDPASFAFGPGLADGTVRGTWAEFKAQRITRNKTFGLDAELDLTDGVQLLVGSQYRQSNYHVDPLRLDPARQATPQLPEGISLADLTLQVTDLDKLLGHGAPASWAAADRDKFREAIGYNESWFCGVECGSGPEGVRETIKGAYGMIAFNTGGLLPIVFRGNAGMRYVHTDQFSFGYVSVDAPEGAPYPTTAERAEAVRRYDDWLPSANIVAELNSDLLLRLSAAKVMSRPDLDPIIPSSNVDAVGRRGLIANPHLDPVRANTYDAALEWYFSPGSLLSIAYFRKDISTYIQRISSLIPFNELGLPESLLANSQTQPTELFTINRLTNTPGGPLEGIEVNAQAPLRFLPGILEDFGVLGTLTLVKSQIGYVLQSNDDGVPTLTTTDDLIGLSRRSASATLYYEDDRFSVRVTGNYRSGYIRTIPSGAADSDHIGNQSMLHMDFSSSYRLTPHIQLMLQAQNLTNEDNVQYIDSIRSDSLFALQSGRTVTAGLNYRF